MKAMTNTRRIELGGEEYDVPVEVYGRAMMLAELRVHRRLVLLVCAERPEHADALMAEWDEYEERMRSRLRLPAREDS